MSGDAQAIEMARADGGIRVANRLVMQTIDIVLLARVAGGQIAQMGTPSQGGRGLFARLFGDDWHRKFVGRDPCIEEQRCPQF